MLIGVVADTHGLFDPKLATLFSGVEAIIHAGDIGKGVFEKLEAIAPVHAIRGNIDVKIETKRFPDWIVRTLGGWRILVVHDLGKPERPQPQAAELIARHDPRIVISGHSHKAHSLEHAGRLYLNPGGAARKRFSLPRTASLLTLGASGAKVVLHSLELDRPLGEASV